MNIGVGNGNTLYLPPQAVKVVKIGLQPGYYGQPYLNVWYEVDSAKDISYLSSIGIVCFGTGCEITHSQSHIETVLMSDGLVWHYYLMN